MFATIRSAILLLALAGSTAGAAPVSFELRFGALPGELTLCRDTFTQNSGGSDYLWAVNIDIDGVTVNEPDGYDAYILIETTRQNAGCTPHVVPTATALSAKLVAWNGFLYDFDNAVPMAIAVDPATASMRVSGDDGGNALSRLSHLSTFQASSSSRYTTSPPTSVLATDQSTPLARTLEVEAVVADAAGDVANCGSPCSPAAPWYGPLDLRALRVDGEGVRPFGDATLELAIRTREIPLTMFLCRDPSWGRTGPENIWCASVDFDGLGNNDFSGAAVCVMTLPQAAGCQTTAVPIEQALIAELYGFDVSGQRSVLGSVPVRLDLNAHRMRLQLDRRQPVLSGLRPESEFSAGSNGDFRPAPFAGAFDSSAAVARGTGLTGSVTDPLFDVTNCTGNGICGAGQWDRILDLFSLQFAVPSQREAFVFDDGFEPPTAQR